MSGISDNENNKRESTEEEELDAHLLGPRKVYHRDGKDIEDAAAFDANPKKLGKVSTPYKY
jgi:hypothetical protein